MSKKTLNNSASSKGKSRARKSSSAKGKGGSKVQAKAAVTRVTKKRAAKSKKQEAPQYETLWCEYGEHEFKRKRVRGRVPKVCPQHREAAAEANRLARLAEDGPRTVIPRKRYENQYTLAKRQGKQFREGDGALFLPMSLYGDLETQLKYAKEVVIHRLEPEQDRAWVSAKGSKEVLHTVLSNLRHYSVERVEVTREPEAVEGAGDDD